MLALLFAALELLPLGAVRPEGALRGTLERQRDGLTGHAEELYEDIGKSDWLTGANVGKEFSWERGPYYARGLVALAFVLDDADLKAKAKRWVDATLASQRDDGDFGPRKDNWWANMLPLAYLRDWADATGDKRVVPFLERYFAYQERALDRKSLADESCWALARGGDEVEAVLWLRDRTGDARWTAFARRLVELSADWTGYYSVGGPGDGSTGYRCHIVNFMQGLKLPALRYTLFGKDEDLNAYAAAFSPEGWVVRQCGRPDGMVNGSEPLSDRSASAGTELCAIAERIVSCGIVVSRTENLAAADDLEDVVYNSLPATVLPDGKGIRYYLLLNQPACVDKGLLFANNGFGGEVTGAICPGPHSGFGCCRSNCHIALPKFVQSMWMRKGNGLASVAHGPSVVTAQLPCGAVSLRAETDYPRSGKITYRVLSGEGEFPLFVRVPRWARAPDAGKFRRYDRRWKKGDAIVVEFPMEIETSFWERQAVAVRRGPLLYALKMDAEMKKVPRYKVPYENGWQDDTGDFPRWEIHPKSAWNYALALDGNRQVRVESAAGGELRVRAVRTSFAGWGTMRADAPARPVDPPFSPLDASRCDAGEEQITLVPIGETQIRITLFPWIVVK